MRNKMTMTKILIVAIFFLFILMIILSLLLSRRPKTTAENAAIGNSSPFQTFNKNNQNTSLKVVSTNINNEIITSSDRFFPIEIFFNQRLLLSNVAVSITPEIDFDKNLKENGTILVIKAKYGWDYDTQYIINVNNSEKIKFKLNEDEVGTDFLSD